MIDIGQKLKIIRESRGLTQEKFGDLINKSKSAYCRMENGEVKVSLEELISVAKALSVPIHEILPDLSALNHQQGNGYSGGVVLGDFTVNMTDFNTAKLQEEIANLRNQLAVKQEEIKFLKEQNQSYKDVIDKLSSSK